MSNKNTKKFTTYGDALNYVLTKRGLSQTWLGEKIKKGDDQISRYVNNKRMPYKRTQKQIADLLAVSIEKNSEGNWVVSQPDSISKIDNRLNQIEQQAAAGNSGELGRDDLVQFLELAEKLIRRSRELLGRLSDD